MDLHQLTAISPIDGRYRSQLQHLDEYFSECALIKYRVMVEEEYFLFLGEKNPQLPWGFFFLIWLWHGCTFMPSAVPNIHSQLNPHPAAFCDELFAFLGRFGEIVFQIQFITSCNMAV